MADFDGTIGVGIVELFPLPDAQTINNELPPTAPQGMAPFGQIAGPYEATNQNDRSTPIVDRDGAILEDTGQYWFELVHVFPTFFELGNLLTTVTRDLEIYNSYREESRQVTSFTNNADSGTSLIGFPSLPATLSESHGIQFQVQVSTNGPPSIDGTLDFTTDVGDISVRITGSRVVMFPFEPETLIEEKLEFLTDVIEAADGTEQRITIRKHPRQSFTMRYRVEEGKERRRLHNLLFDWQSRVFGVPVWFEARKLDADVSAGETTITVDTAYGDFRTGSLAIVWQDSETFDALEIEDQTANSLTFASTLANSYTARKALVIPLRVALTDDTISRERWLNNLEEFEALWRIIDNEADIADASSFDTYNSKVALLGFNFVAGQSTQDNMLRRIDRIDNETAPILQFSDWENAQYQFRRTFLGYSLESMWTVRQLVHELKGSQKSFYMPTFSTDLVAVDDLSSGTALLDVQPEGYVDYIRNREPLTSIIIYLSNGTYLIRDVVDYTQVDANTDRLTVDTNWPSTISVNDITKISFLRLCRIADDLVEFNHRRIGYSRVGFNVRTVR